MNTTAIALDPLRLPLQGLRLIEASAGTGKTWTIAALYLRLVLGHTAADAEPRRPLLPPEILVVTFTEAATLELRERIRQRLSEAARFFRGQIAGDEFLQQLLAERDPQQRLGDARILQLAADWMDEAAIYTIHGWCNRMLRQHAFDSGSLFKLELDAADPQLLAAVARDYWRHCYYPLAEQQIVAVSRFAATPAVLLERIERLLGEHQAQWHKGAQPLTASENPLEPAKVLQVWADWEIQQQTLLTQARQAWKSEQTAVEQWLNSASAQGWLNGTSYPAKTFAQRLQALADWATHGADCDPKWLAGFAYSRVKMKQAHQDKLPAFAAFLALDQLADHRDREPEIAIDLSLHARHWIAQAYAMRKRRLARLDYDDLLLQLDQALVDPATGERLAEAIRQQYPLAMIDEFQDTDPLQYRIFHSVYLRQATADSGLLLIGDPKQAIYAFRGADIHTYLRAKREARTQVYTLTRNFRSTQDLVEAVNRIFQHAETHAAAAFKFAVAGQNNPLPYWPVTAQGRAENFMLDGRRPAALTVWLPEQANCHSGDEYRTLMASATAARIVDLLQAAGEGRAGFQRDAEWQALQAADMAILVRSRREANCVRQALSQRGLRSVYLSDRDSVFATQEALDVLRWLQAGAEPQDARLLRAALASDSLGLSLAELDTYNRDELRWEAEVERFKSLQQTWRQQGVLAMLRQLLQQFQLPQKCLLVDDGERVLTNLLHLSELLQRASLELDGEAALIRYLVEAIAEGRADDDSLLRLESDSDLLKVVTLHKSKGLEYPLVFLPFICSFREVTGKQAYFRYHADDGELHIDLGKGEAAKQAADNERLQEDLRLLYVGLTRARHACWLGVAALKTGKGEKSVLHKSAMGYLLAGGEVIEAGDLSAKLHTLRADCEQIAVVTAPQSNRSLSVEATVHANLSARKCGKNDRPSWWIASYSALRLAPANPAAGDFEPPETSRQANLGEDHDSQAGFTVSSTIVLDQHHFPCGSQTGVFLHGLLEGAANIGFANLTGDDKRRRQLVGNACQRGDWSGWSDTVDRWLLRLLNSPLAVEQDATVCLAHLSKRDYQPELEFWFASQQADSRGFDALVREYLLPGLTRPALQAQQLNGMLKGFADLVFQHQGRYYLLDYKSNQLGIDNSAYHSSAMQQAILQHRYDLQACLYTLALQRLLKSRLGQQYDYRRHIGGMLFWFIRGVDAEGGGICKLRPEQALIDSLDSLFSGKEVVDAC